MSLHVLVHETPAGAIHKLGVVLHEYDGYFTVTSYDASAVIGSAGGGWAGLLAKAGSAAERVKLP